MFSPEATTQGTLSLRNPRRRPRNSSEDPSSVAGQAVKRRKRSSLTPSTFEAPPKLRANGHLPSTNGDLSARGESPELVQSVSRQTSLTVRRRPSRNEKDKKLPRQPDGIILTKTSRLSITKDSSIPDELQEVFRGKESWHACFNEALQFAVILTPSKATVWHYAQNGPTSNASRTYTVALPHNSPKATPLLPLGTVVHDSTVGEAALLIIEQDGSVIYWESLSAASHADIARQKQLGIQGSLGGLLSGEAVVDVTTAELDGFIVNTSAGKVIHLCVRDTQGKLAISTKMLRGNHNSGSGLFSGLKNVFSSSGWRKDIASARCPATRSKSRRNCIIATKQCVFQTWDLARHASDTLEAEVDAKQSLLHAIEARSNEENLKDPQVLDFAFFPDDQNRPKDSFHLLLLVSANAATGSQYFVVDVTLFGDTLDINLVQQICCWDTAGEADSSEPAFRPRLVLPSPAHTAFIISHTFIITTSLVQVEEGPSLQLQRESNLLSEPLQDILHFTSSRGFHAVGCTSDLQNSYKDQARCLFFVDNFGLVQANVIKIDDERPPSVRRAELCQSKIEQAVFFGDPTTSLFDFYRTSPSAKWEAQEIEEASLRINASILDSTSTYLSAINPSMETQLKDRSIALKELIKFVSRWGLSEAARWQLLWSAEKMAAARSVWVAYSMHLKKREGQRIEHNNRNIVLLREALDMLNESNKQEARLEHGETDIVRHYLTKDISNLELVLPWAAHALHELYDEGLRDLAKQALLVDQANDIQISALGTAFEFRQQNCELYGFAQSLIKDGIYIGSYSNWPDVWTSDADTVRKVRDLANLSRECAIENSELVEDGPGMLDLETLTKIAADGSRLAYLSCQVFEERLRTLRDRPGEVGADALHKDYIQSRMEFVSGLVRAEIPEEGIRLAEKYDDVEALANAMTGSLMIITERLRDGVTPLDEKEELQRKLPDFRNRILTYFTKYGAKWAEAFYTRRMQTASMAAVFREEDYMMGDFMKSKPELLKVRWMWEIMSQRGYEQAALDLLESNSREDDLWNKKVKLSLAKLSILASKEAQSLSDKSMREGVRNANRRLTAIDIQDRLYSFTRPLLRTAIDHIAEVDLAVDSFAVSVKRPILVGALRHHFDKLVRREVLHEDNLIETLTLMNLPGNMLDDEDFGNQRFYWALELASSKLTEDEAAISLQQRIIWTRCLLQDDWQSINDTEYEGDKEVMRKARGTAAFKTLLAGFSTGLFDAAPPLAPLDLLEISPSAEVLRATEKFREASDNTVNALSHELIIEFKTLTKMAEKGRLELWWPGLVGAAKTALREERDNSGATLAHREAEKRNVGAKLSNQTPNGLPNGAHHPASAAAKDADGDVAMG